MGLAFVHGCQFTAVPRLFHQVHDMYKLSTTALPICEKATVYPAGTAVEKAKMKV